MITDCVALEMYFGDRESALGAVAFGTVIVNRADVFGDEAAGDEAGVGAGAAVSDARGAEDPPPEHEHSAAAAAVARSARFIARGAARRSAGVCSTP